jgi:hypothetical protein
LTPVKNDYPTDRTHCRCRPIPVKLFTLWPVVLNTILVFVATLMTVEEDTPEEEPGPAALSPAISSTRTAAMSCLESTIEADMLFGRDARAVLQLNRNWSEHEMGKILSLDNDPHLRQILASNLKHAGLETSTMAPARD